MFCTADIASCKLYSSICSSVEYDGLVAVAEDAAVEMPANGAGEDDALEIASACDQIVYLVTVRDAGYILLDDGAVVKHFGDVMAGGPD